MQSLSLSAFVTAPFRAPRAGFAVGRARARMCATHPAARPAEVAAAAARLAAQAAKTAPQKPAVRVVCCDMDGTILDTSSAITIDNAAAVARVVRETDVLFVPATGKSRAGALKAMGPAGTLLRETHSDGVPGVYLQGLQVFGPGGTLVHESGVSDDVARDVAALASELGLSLIAYSGDDILCADQTAFTDLLPTYHEPACRVIGRWDSVIGDKVLNKFIFMEDPKRIDAIRPKVAERLGGRAALTQAQGNMLEVLPPAASKGDGVKRLLRHLGVAPAEVMAIGDAENDLEMLRMVGVSCAVQNALPTVKQAARFTDIPSNNDSGVAAALERFVFVNA